MKPIAGRRAKARATDLLREFDSLPALLTACRSTHARDGIFEHLATMGEVLSSVALGRLSAQPVLPSYAATIEYLMLEMAGLPVEHVRVLFLNTKNRLIANETISRGTIDQSVVHVREVIKRALELGTASIILAHNHPSGDPTPSKQDIALTRKVQEGGHHLGVALHDHMIFASSGWVSFRASGLL